MRRNELVALVSTNLLGMILCGTAQADPILGTTYSYGTSPMPAFSGGTFYRDDGAGTDHAGYATAGAFDIGDLNDGIQLADGTNPVAAGNTMAAWDPVPPFGGNPIPVDITFDLGAVFNVNEVVISSYVHEPFRMGAPDDVTVSFSSDGVSFGAGTFVVLGSINADDTFKGYDFATGVAGVGQFVRLSFDGDAQTGNNGNFDKFSVTEVAFDGIAAVPEPTTAALLGMALVALGLRRRSSV